MQFQNPQPVQLAMPVVAVTASRARLGECPVWDAAQRVLYWVDILNHRVHRFDPETGGDRFFDVGDVVGPMAPAGDHRLLIAQRHTLAFLDTRKGSVTPVMTVETEAPGSRFNDGKCDSRGRFWLGSISQEPGAANLYRYDPDGSLQQMESGLTISNGLGWSPDERTFYLTDSAKGCIYAYDFDVNKGAIAHRRVLIDLSDESFEPDGLTVDSEGCIWSAMWDGWCVMRFDPDGQQMMRLPLPVQRPTCPTFGGSSLADLYITTASVGLSQQEIQDCIRSGDLFCISADVTGLPTHSFGVC